MDFRAFVAAGSVAVAGSAGMPASPASSAAAKSSPERVAGNRTRRMNLLALSTRVPTLEAPPRPMMRSPSTSPILVRCSTAAGRWSMALDGVLNRGPRCRARRRRRRDRPVRRFLGEFTRKSVAPTEEQPLIDRLVTDVPFRTIGVRLLEPSADLLRAPLLQQPFLHHRPQLLVASQDRAAVPAGPVQPRSDRAYAKALGAQHADSIPLQQRWVPPRPGVLGQSRARQPAPVRPPVVARRPADPQPAAGLHGADSLTDQLPVPVLEGKASLASWSSHVHPFIQAGCCVEV